MTEMTWSTMTIGGRIAESRIAELAEAIESDFFGTPLYHGNSIEEEIWRAINGGTHFTVEGEANYGDPDEVVAFCQEHGLTYSRNYDAQPGNWNAGGAYWAPGMELEAAFDADSDGHALMHVADIRRHLADGSLQAELDRLETYAGKSIPPLTLVPSQKEAA